MKLTRRGFALASATATLTGLPAFADPAFPSRSIRMIAPYAAGGGQDITARLLGEQLRAAFGQPIVVENRSGASGMVGAQTTAQAAPDGYTLMLGGSGETAINVHLFRGRMSYDPLKDLLPIALVVQVPIVVFTNPSFPARTPAELVALAKSKPGELSYSSSGIGNPQHLAGELFNYIAGTEILHVPYRGAAPAVTDVASGRVSIGFNGLAAALPLIRDGKLHPIAVTSRTRLPQLPDTPAFAEYEPLKEYELVNWFGVFGPTGIPQPVVTRVQDAVTTAMQDANLRRKFEEQGLLPGSLPPSEFKDFVAAESAKFGRIIEQAKITADG